MDPIQEFSRVQLTLDNLVIPNERLRNTPSSKDGCPHELEIDLRIVGCEYIQLAGLLLRLPQVAMATAQVLFQRFFYSKSFVKYNFMNVAMACIFLAAKIEENCRRPRDVANVFHHLKQKRTGRSVVPMDYMGKEYFTIKDSIIKYERFVLKDLGFCVHVRHPHKLIITYLQIMELEKNKQLAQRSWNFMNDSYRTNVFVRFSPEAIACACIFLSARQLKVGLPQRPPWWTLYHVNYEDIEAIATEVLALYSRPRVFLVDLEKKLNALKESKKQVEIKEVNLKKNAEAKANSLSPRADARKGSSESPRPSQSKPSPLVQSSQAATAPTSPITATTRLSPTVNGTGSNGSPITTTTTTKRQLKTSRSISPCPPKRRKLSLSPLERRSSPLPPPPPLDKSRGHHSPPRERIKPKISPIRVAVSGDSYSDHSSPSLSPIRENGIPEQYRRDFSKHRSRNKHHRHRHHHHDRSSKTSGSSSRRHRHREEGEGVSGGRVRSSKNRSGQEHRQSSKSHRTESDRYR